MLSTVLSRVLNIFLETVPARTEIWLLWINLGGGGGGQYSIITDHMWGPYIYINWHDKLKVKQKSGRPCRTQKKGKEKKSHHHTELQGNACCAGRPSVIIILFTAGHVRELLPLRNYLFQSYKYRPQSTCKFDYKHKEDKQ